MHITSGCTGQISAVTFCAKTRTKAANKNLLGEPGVITLQGGALMLTKHHKELYDSFYEATHANEHLDTKTEVLVGLAAAMGMNCEPCTKYYLHQAKKAGVKKGEVSEVIAKVMAVAAGQKKLQAQQVIEEHKIDLSSFK